MSFYRVKDGFNSFVPILSPPNFKFSRKLGVDIISDFASKDHGLFQRRSIVKGMKNYQENLEVYKDIIERSLLSARGKKSENKDSEKCIENGKYYGSLNEKVRVKRKNKAQILEPVRRFMSVKPVKYRKDRLKSPIFKESILMIVNNKHKNNSKIIQKKYHSVLSSG